MASKLLVHQCICIIIVLATLSMLLSPAQARTRAVDGLSMQARHEAWMTKHGRVYKNLTEKEMRYKIFKANAEYIESTNALGRPYKLGLNKFSDLTNEEFRSYYNGNKEPFNTMGLPSSKPYWKASLNQDSIPDSMDWREKGAVTPVKNQGRCGCCWAFTAVAAIEGIIQISTGQLTSLSEQELLDCNNYDSGCNGGLAAHAYQYLVDNNKGLTTEENYPYQEAKGTCNADYFSSSSTTVQISSYHLVTPNSEDELLMAVANQPVGVSIDASCQQFQYYKEGVLTESCGTNLHHAVTLVGYGTADDGTNYWIAKNSWGADWGDQGYLRLQRGYADPQGICGLAIRPSFPVA